MTGGPASTAPPPPPPAAAHAAPAPECLRCGAPLAPDQRVCLECGHDLAVSYRRPPDWRIWPVIVGLVALALGAAGGVAISSAVHTKTKNKTIVTSSAPAPAPAARAPVAPVAPPAAPAPAPLAIWPAGTRAYTVVLATNRAQAPATVKAREAISRGIPAGVLRSADHPGPPPGLFVVFAGQYKTSAEARSQADGFAARGFPGAYPRLITK